MSRHTVTFNINNEKIDVKKEYISSFLIYMQLNKEIIDKLGTRTHAKWHMSIGDEKRIHYHTSVDPEKYIDLIFRSSEFINDGWSNISIGEEKLSEKDIENDDVFKKWLQDSIKNTQVFFNSDLNLDSNITSVDFDIEEEHDSQFFFWLVKRLFEVLPNNINDINVSQTSGNTDLYCIYPDRINISWMQLIKAELIAADVPSAYAVWYMPNIGSVVISTQEVFDNDNKKHKDIAHAIEQELHKIGLLPILGDHDLKFISREEWRKNKGLLT